MTDERKLARDQAERWRTVVGRVDREQASIALNLALRLAGHPVSLRTASTAPTGLLFGAARAFAEHGKLRLRRLEGEWDPVVNTPAPTLSPAPLPASPGPDRSLADLLELYHAERKLPDQTLGEMRSLIQ